MRLRFFPILAVAVTIGVAALAGPALASTGTASTAPVYSGDFPDPSILLAPNGTYYAYATGNNSNLQVMSSPDLTTWGPISDPLPKLPRWATIGKTWAPGVAYIGGQYVMYYTAEQASTGDQCIGLATASKPAGPFTDKSWQPFICQGSLGGSIDANPVVIQGVPYLLWKSDDNHLGTGQATHLWAQQLTSNGLGLVTGTPTLLLTGSLTDWAAPITEGPTMAAVPGGGYDLFYGGGWWNTASAGIGYATCASPLSACVDQSTAGPWMGTNSSINKNGPSGPNIFTGADGKMRIAYHAWGSTIGYPGGQRKLWIDTVSFSGSTPSIP